MYYVLSVRKRNMDLNEMKMTAQDYKETKTIRYLCTHRLALLTYVHQGTYW